MAAALDNLTAQYENALTRLAELDAVPVNQRARMTYEDKGRTFGWNEYRASLQATVDKYPAQVEGLLKAQQMIAGPFTVIGPPGC